MNDARGMRYELHTFYTKVLYFDLVFFADLFILKHNTLNIVMDFFLWKFQRTH